MKKMLLAIALACVFSGTALAGDIPGVDITAPSPVAGEIPGVDSMITVLLTIIGAVA